MGINEPRVMLMSYDDIQNDLAKTRHVTKIQNKIMGTGQANTKLQIGI